MPTTVTLRLPDETYNRFRVFAERENRPLSTFIQTVILQYTESEQYADEFEMAEIRSNKALNESLKQGYADAKAMRGRFDLIASPLSVTRVKGIIPKPAKPVSLSDMERAICEGAADDWDRH